MNGVVGDWRLASDSDFLAVFRLPGVAEQCDELQQKHPLGRRDERIQFFEDTHTSTKSRAFVYRDL